MGEPLQVTTAWRDIIEKGNDNYYLMATSDHSSFPAGDGIFAGTSTTEAFGATPLALNTWAHIAATYDGTTLRMYVDGSQVASAARTGVIKTSTNALTLGGDPFYGQYFRGTIDEVRIYNRALSAAEVQTDMNTRLDRGGSPGRRPSALAHRLRDPRQFERREFGVAFHCSCSETHRRRSAHDRRTRVAQWSSILVNAAHGRYDQQRQPQTNPASRDA